MRGRELNVGKRIIVIGSGIIGASIAWHLAKRGAEVTVVEAGEAGGLATRNSWGWINASCGNPEDYFRDVLVRISQRGVSAKDLTPHRWKELFEPEVTARRNEVLSKLAGVE